MFEFTRAELDEMQGILKNIGGTNGPVEHAKAASEFAKAVETPLRKVLLSGNIINGIFKSMPWDPNTPTMFPLDMLVPGQERDFYAYVLPNHGTLPERRVESDYLMIPTYQIGNSVDAEIKYVQRANWAVISRMMEILEAGFIKKMNDDGWQTLLAAAADRNIVVYDSNASIGQFTPALVTLMKTFMRRNGGGNSATMNRSRLTDLYVSPEAIDDIRSWNLEIVPDPVRANIYYSEDGGTETVRIFGVNLHDLDELGESQEYQLYFTSSLSGTMPGSDVEIVVGIDANKDVFVNPIVENVTVYEDNTRHRERTFGLYGWAEMGFGVLDSRAVLLGSL